MKFSHAYTFVSKEVCELFICSCFLSQVRTLSSERESNLPKDTLQVVTVKSHCLEAEEVTVWMVVGVWNG